MEEGLKLKISADLGQTIAALREMQREVAKTGAGAKGLGDGVTGASNKMPQLAKNTGQANIALVNFGRVVQDAPFGLIGIANNIDPLISSFQSLKKETGSTGAAFKGLAGALAGPAGIAIAVSAVTSAFIAFGPQIKEFLFGTKQITEEQKKQAEAMNDMVRSLSKQKEEFNAYLSIAKDVSKSDNDREAALAKLNKIIPDHIGVLTKQNIATAEGARITAVYVQALEARATAELYINRIAENNVKIFEKRNEQERIYAEFNAKILQRQAAAARFRAAGKEEIALTIDNEINNLIKERNDLLKTNSDEIKNSIRENNKLRESYTSLLPTLEILNGKDGVGGLSDKTKEQVRNLAAQNGVINSMRDNIETMNKLEQQRVENQKLLLQLQMQGSTLSGTGMKPVKELTPIQQLSIVGSDDAKSNIQKLVEESNKLNKSFELTDELINTVGNEFANLFTNISKDGTKAFEDFAKAVAETTTRILINYAVTQALKALIDSISPGVGTALDASGLSRAAVNQLNPGAVLRGSDINLSSLRALG
jgi:tetrahydromethanopterin S-methyltransferase subunit B